MLTPTSEKKLFLIDAFAVIFRSFFAFSKNPRINSRGLNTSAALGFTNTLLEILQKEKPTHIAVVFDPPGGSHFRNEAFPEYKGHREETPEGILSNIEPIKSILEAFQIPIIQIDGYEADDVIGTLVKQAEKDGFFSYMVTSDKDYGQLVSEKTWMYRLSRGKEKAQLWGIKEVCERFDIQSVDQVIDFLGLTGDASDNIPGMPNIGPKTASKLLKEFHSMEEIFQHSNQLKGKQKTIFETFQDQGLLSKQLVRIITDVPVSFDPQKMIVQAPKRELLQNIFDQLEFRGLTNRILGEQQITPQNLFDNVLEDPTQEEPIYQQEIKSFDKLEKTYVLVSTKKERETLINTLSVQKEFCFDTETTSLDALHADLVGISFSFRDNEAFYIAFPADFEQTKTILMEFQPIFSSSVILKIAHNMKYDLKVLARYDLLVCAPLFDTMIAHYLIDPESKHGMDFLAEKYLSYQPISIETLIGKKGKNQGNMGDLEPEQIYQYACEDADITRLLKKQFDKQIKENHHLDKLFRQMEMPLVNTLLGMEREGIAINEAFLHDYSQELDQKLEELTIEITQLAQGSFNIDSPKQLGEVLFERLQIATKAKKTKTGQYATSEDILRSLVDKHDIIGKILAYREYKKLKSTYVDPLPSLRDSVDGRIHTQFMQTVTATGRLSSINPNLQNIPIRTPAGRRIRAAFVARNSDYLFMAADYSQIELRVIAALSRDENMLEAFALGEDIHQATASKVYGIKPQEVTREQRSAAKAVNFGIIYGQSAFGLAQNLKISRTEAQQMITNYFQQYPNIKKYMDEMVEVARKLGYVETLFFRRRYLPDIRSANATIRGFAERNAVNSPIQGTAADIIKMAMIKVDKEIQTRKLKSKLILQVHDELIFDAYREEVDELRELVQRNMENPAEFSIPMPLKVEIGIGDNWLDAH